MIMGTRPSTAYQVTASSGGASSIILARTSSPLSVSGPGDVRYNLQVSYTDTAAYAITDTENDDTDPITGTAWRFTCDDDVAPIGVCDGTFTTARETGRTVNFSSTAGATFNPPSAAMGTQTSVDGGGRVPVAVPEVAAFLVGGGDPASLTHTITTTINPTFTISVIGPLVRQEAPALDVETVPVTLACMDFPRMTPRSFCDPLAIVNFGETVCRRDSEGIGTYVDRANGYSENTVVVVRAEHQTSSPADGRVVRKFSDTLIVQGSASLPVDYFAPFVDDPVRKSRARPGLHELNDHIYPIKEGTTANNFSLAFSRAAAGCREFVAKAFIRTRVGLSVEPLQELPAPALEFRLGPPADTPLLTATIAAPHWADLVSASPGPMRSLATVSIGSNDVPDWAEVHGWDLLRNPPVLPAGGQPEPSEGDPNKDFAAADVRVHPAEPEDVFAQVMEVEFDLTLREGAPGQTPFGRDEFVPTRGTDDTGWKVPRLIKIDPGDPFMRVDAPFDVSGGQAGFGEYSVNHLFSQTVAHEARHVWQNVLLAQTGPPACNDEDPCKYPGTTNRVPDNNDDFVFYVNGDVVYVLDSSGNPDPSRPVIDCLPEQAWLIGDPTVILSGPTGSARALIDSPANLELDLAAELHGERPGGTAEAELADRCGAIGDPDLGILSPARKLTERDAIRFSRALDSVVAGP